MEDLMEDKRSSWTAADAIDYKGCGADKYKTGGWLPAALILGIEIIERLSTMGIAVNLVTYLGGTMHLPSATSANIVTNFMGTSFFLCLLGGYLADALLGRYMTIAIFSVVQTLGTGMLSITTKLHQLKPPPCETHAAVCQQANEFQMGILYFALYLIALGTGGLKSSVSGFGTDQFDEKDEKERAQMTHFFSRFFFFISIGTLIAVTVLVYIQDEVSRSLAYGICSVSMVLAISIFVLGTKRYRYKEISGSLLVHILQVIFAAIRNRKMDLLYDTDLYYEDSTQHSRVQHTHQFRFLDKASIVAKEDTENGSATPNPWKICSITRVEEVKMMIKLLPIWATTIMFWTTYAQMITFSVEQATTMRRSIGKFQIPAGSLTVFLVLAILITLAIYDRLIMPFWKRWKGRPGFSSLQRIAIGLVLSTAGMAVAALVEEKRLSVVKSEGRDTETLSLTVFILIPQFLLIGSAEAFTYTGQLDFFITQSPKSMKTMSTGLFLATLSLGFFLSSALVSIVTKVTGTHGERGWLGDKINYGRLDLFYWLLAGLGIINFGLYLICAVWYKTREDQNPKGSVHMEKQIDDDDDVEK